MLNLINGLPEELRYTRQDEWNKVYEQTERLYLVGSHECVQHIAVKMNFPKFIDNRLCLHHTLTYLNVEIDGKMQRMPISADIHFFRRPQDDMIIATAVCASMLCHGDIFEKEVVKLFPQVAKDQHGSLFWDNSVEHSFFYWCEEKVDSRRAFIKEVLSEL